MSARPPSTAGSHRAARSSAVESMPSSIDRAQHHAAVRRRRRPRPAARRRAAGSSRLVSRGHRRATVPAPAPAHPAGQPQQPVEIGRQLQQGKRDCPRWPGAVDRPGRPGGRPAPGSPTSLRCRGNGPAHRRGPPVVRPRAGRTAHPIGRWPAAHRSRPATDGRRTPSASADGRSSRWASSTSSAIGRLSAARQISTQRAGADREPIGRCTGPQRERGRRGRRPAGREAHRSGRAPVAATATARRTGLPARPRSRSPAAAASRRLTEAAQSSSAVLPMPASPVSTSTPLSPTRAPAISGCDHPPLGLPPDQHVAERRPHAALRRQPNIAEPGGPPDAATVGTAPLS